MIEFYYSPKNKINSYEFLLIQITDETDKLGRRDSSSSQEKKI